MIIPALGKGEVDSSILSGSTINPLILLSISIHRIVDYSGFGHEYAGDTRERDSNRWGGPGNVRGLFHVKRPGQTRQKRPPPTEGSSAREVRMGRTCQPLTCPGVKQ